ncbi:MAG: DUF1028 domain-containing protein [Anaerolineales bacterium]|nr:DUF1028 domain-containing protein [Anaerolineales bacterium]
MRPITTFSIVAYDPKNEEWGVAVQSKFLAVGAVVPWARAGAGTVATQSYANLMYGPDGLDLMEGGKTAQETIQALTGPDEQRALRQVGVVDKNGKAASFTGEECHNWAGGIVGEGYACQGNILLPGTVEAMSAAFEEARQGPGELADWLVKALAAGQAAGGDSRGRQSASVLVVRAGGGYGGNNDRYLDLRVDDHPTPIAELERILAIHHLFFQSPDPADLVPLSEVAADLQHILRKTGHYSGEISGAFDAETRKALRALVGIENLEERWVGDEDEIDIKVVEFLQDKFKPNRHG